MHKFKAGDLVTVTEENLEMMSKKERVFLEGLIGIKMIVHSLQPEIDRVAEHYYLKYANNGNSEKINIKIRGNFVQRKVTDKVFIFPFIDADLTLLQRVDFEEVDRNTKTDDILDKVVTVMAVSIDKDGSRTEESVGCDLDSVDEAAIFCRWLQEDISRFSEFMPDTEPLNVRSIYLL